ncbi:unnamed protein product [Orchesella dallaii]|uniref:SH2 domain-containing protein n=1 Tax=Orchesella dallaii TaxID=48710 RepID=A0ABP1PM77_9HEXA
MMEETNLYPTLITETDLAFWLSKIIIKVADDAQMEDLTQSRPGALLAVDQVRNVEWGCGIATFCGELKNELIYNLNKYSEIFEKLQLGVEKFRVRFVRDLSYTFFVQSNTERLTLKFIGDMREEIHKNVMYLFALCKNCNFCIENLANCHQRQQQLHAFGENTTGELELKMLFRRANIPEKKKQILNKMRGIYPIITDAVSSYNAGRTITINFQRADAALKPEYYQLLDFTTYKSEFDKLELSIHNKFCLQVTEQPETVIQTKINTRSMSVRLHNFNKVSVVSAQLKVYLISESAAKCIIEADTTPDIPAPAGKLQAAGEPTLTEEEEESPWLQPRSKRPCDDSTSKISCDDQEGLNLKFTSHSLNPKHWDIEIPFKILNVVRKNKAKVKAGENESSELVAGEKYCFLFLSEVPTEIQNHSVKVWTTSLPFIVTTYSGHREIASGVMAWDNAFPLPGRTDFGIRQKAKLCQFTVMLKGFFNLSVGRELKPYHVKCLEEKLKELNGNDFPDVLLTKIMQDVGNSSFWCWFYRTTLILNRYLKDLWDGGYFKAFINFEMAEKLLNDNGAVPGLFLLRFSDEEAGAVSIVFVLNDKTIYRIGPFEFYKDKCIAQYAVDLLRNLNGIYFSSGGDVLSLVLTEENTRVDKKTAFKGFYKYADDNKLQVKPKIRYFRMRYGLEPSSVRNQSSNPNPQENRNVLTALFDDSSFAVTAAPTFVARRTKKKKWYKRILPLKPKTPGFKYIFGFRRVQTGTKEQSERSVFHKL